MFHSALGLRDVELDAAAALRDDGHQVTTPDLYDGATAETLADGLALKDAVGWARIVERARDALGDVSQDSVLAGISMGAGVVSEMWRDRPATRAVLLIHGYARIPDNVAACTLASLHVAVDDPFAPDGLVARWQTAAEERGVNAQVHRYSDVGHFFTDQCSSDYDEAAAQILWRRIRGFLRQVD